MLSPRNKLVRVLAEPADNSPCYLWSLERMDGQLHPIFLSELNAARMEHFCALFGQFQRLLNSSIEARYLAFLSFFGSSSKIPGTSL